MVSVKSSSTGSAAGTTIRVLSYNMLADCYTRPQYFPYVSPGNLAFFNRAKKVVAELKSTMADIICLQEVDHFADFYWKELTNLGYDVYYNNKGHGRYDGIVVGLIKDKFQLFGSPAEEVRYDELKPKHLYPEFFQGYIGQIVACRHIASDTVILVGNTHLWAMGSEDTRFGQTALLTHRLSEAAAKYGAVYGKIPAVVVCGDMNSLPGGVAFRRFYNIPTGYAGWKGPDYENIAEFEAQYPHALMLRSAYEEYNKVDTTKAVTHSEVERLAKGHPTYTNFTESFQGCLDYIFYDSRYRPQNDPS